jgi:FkbM family methyltransferase
MNPSPRLIQHIVDSRAFEKDRLCVVDVGARLGYEPHWEVFRDQIRLLGFEPDPVECEVINRQVKPKGHECFPVALHQGRGRRDFYITQSPACCGFYKADQSFVSRFPDQKNVSVIRVSQMETCDLDSFAREKGIESVDFMKLDVEGAELDVLKGAASFLKSCVFGLSVEFMFTRWHEGRPVFREIDEYLAGLGFSLHDAQLFRHARSTLSPFRFHPAPGPTKEGQIIWGQAIYFRDAFKEMESGKNWPAARVLKLASVMEVYGLRDCAIEAVQKAGECGVMSATDVERYSGLLVPVKGASGPTYAQYLADLERSTARRQTLKRLVPRGLWKAIRNVLARCRDGINRIIAE